MTEVTVDRDVFAHGEPWYEDGELAGWSTSPAFLVVCDDLERGAAALHAAGQRMYYVNEHGQEFPAEEDDGRYYNPSWISDVYLTGTGAAIYVDTKGDTTRRMGEAMIAILIEELTARGVAARIAAPGMLDPTLRVWTPPGASS